MVDGINYTGDFPHYVLDHLFDGQIIFKCCRSKQCQYASNNHSRDQIKISNRSIFDRVCNVGD